MQIHSTGHQAVSPYCTRCRCQIIDFQHRVVNDRLVVQMKKLYFVYILGCSDKSFYTGYTDNLDARLKKHNSGKAAKYTSGRRPVTLVYCEEHATKNSAMSREMKIKRLTRAQKEELVTGAG